MTTARGLWITIGDSPRLATVEQSIARDDQFSTVVATRVVKPKDAELAIVSLDGTQADFVCVSRKGRLVATGEITVVLSNMVPLSKATVEEIKALLPKRHQHHFKPSDPGVHRITPRLWEQVLEVIVQDDPAVAKGVTKLRHLIASSRTRQGRIEGGLEVFERDAVATSIQAWGGTGLRKKVLRQADPRLSTPVAPFLSQLKEVTIREDPLINHDHLTFPGLEVLKPHIVGSVVLGDTRGDEYLTVLNCNRQPLEQTLGVDLIYYAHRYDSFVLVQYKRMKANESGVLEYRPDNDSNHAIQLKRMRETTKALRAIPTPQLSGDTGEFRLSRAPFYMKLCESKSKAALDSGMVSGMYIPLGLWRRQLKSPATRGPRGGVVMNWDNCKRRFNNSEFTNLLRHGWIGSAAGQSKHLSQIIEAVLGSGRMLIFAATSAGVSSLDLKRDGWGRFAANDDPDGAM